MNNADNYIDNIELCAVFMCFVLAAVTYACQMIFTHNIGASFQVLAKSLLLLNFIINGKQNLFKYYNLDEIKNLQIILSLLLVSLFGYIINKFGVDLLSNFINILFIYVFIRSCIFWFKNFKLIHLYLLGIVLIFSLYIASVVWSSGYHGIDYRQRILTNTMHIDTLFHSSIANMIKTYGVPSTGLDGVPYVPYHWGSHLLFACLSPIIGCDIITFYNVVYPIVFVPLYFFVFWGVTSAVRDDETSQSSLASILLFTFFLHVVAMRFLFHEWGLWHPFVSESTLISIIIVFSLISSLRSISSNLYNFGWIIPIIVVLATVSKISTGYVLLCALVYIAIRHFRVKFLVIALISSLLFYLTFKYAVGVSVNGNKISSAGIFASLSSNLNLLSIFRWYALFVLFISILAVRGSITKYKSEIEVVIISSIAALIPCIVLNLNLPDSSYFKSIPFWLSAALLGSQSSWISKKYHSNILLKYMILILFLLPCFYYLIKSMSDFVNYMRNNASDYNAKVTSNGFAKIVSELHKTNSLNNFDKSHSRVYLNAKCSFWYEGNFDKNYDQYKRPFYIPALTGIALISGTDNISDIAYKYYGYVNYNLTGNRTINTEQFHNSLFRDNIKTIISNSTPDELEVKQYPFSKMRLP